MGLRLLAALVMAGLVPAAVAWNAWHRLPSDLLLAVAVLAGVTLWQWAEVMGSVTRLDGRGLSQGLFRAQRIDWADVTQARLLAWRGQESWFGARLILQVRGRGRRVVRLGNRPLVQAADAALRALTGDQAESRSSPPM